MHAYVSKEGAPHSCEWVSNTFNPSPMCLNIQGHCMQEALCHEVAARRPFLLSAGPLALRPAGPFCFPFQLVALPEFHTKFKCCPFGHRNSVIYSKCIWPCSARLQLMQPSLHLPFPDIPPFVIFLAHFFISCFSAACLIVHPNASYANAFHIPWCPFKHICRLRVDTSFEWRPLLRLAPWSYFCSQPVPNFKSNKK
jgi:hypothetical protein